MKKLQLSNDQMERVAKFMKGKKEATLDNEVWDLVDTCVMYLGAEELVEELIRAMSTEEAMGNLEFIMRMHEIPTEEEEEEDF